VGSLNDTAELNRFPFARKSQYVVDNQGSRYLDFDPDIDEVAAYGLGALVAGKVLVKTGLLVILLAFLKKFGILIAIGAGAFLKTLFSRRKEKAIEDHN